MGKNVIPSYASEERFNKEYPEGPYVAYQAAIESIPVIDNDSVEWAQILEVLLVEKRASIGGERLVEPHGGLLSHRSRSRAALRDAEQRRRRDTSGPRYLCSSGFPAPPAMSADAFSTEDEYRTRG